MAGEALSAVRAPTLLVVGGLDQVVLGLNRQAAERLACQHEVVVVPGATHLFEEPGALDGWLSWLRAGSASTSSPLERGQVEDEPPLTSTGEAYRGLGLGPLTAHLGHDALAVTGMDDRLPGPEAQVLGAGALDRRARPGPWRKAASTSCWRISALPWRRRRP